MLCPIWNTLSGTCSIGGAQNRDLYAFQLVPSIENARVLHGRMQTVKQHWERCCDKPPFYCQYWKKLHRAIESFVQFEFLVLTGLMSCVSTVLAGVAISGTRFFAPVGNGLLLQSRHTTALQRCISQKKKISHYSICI